MLQPCPGSVGEEEREVADDEIVAVRPSQLACQPEIREPQLRPCLPRVLGDGGQGSELGRERRPSYGPAEDPRTWWFGRGALILLTVVASSTSRVVASAHPLFEAGSTVATVLLVAEAIRGYECPVPCALSADRGLPYASGRRCAMLRGTPLPSGGRALGPSDCGIFQEILEFALDTPPLGG
jgi:hypothetical protein